MEAPALLVAMKPLATGRLGLAVLRWRFLLPSETCAFLPGIVDVARFHLICHLYEPG